MEFAGPRSSGLALDTPVWVPDALGNEALLSFLPWVCGPPWCHREKSFTPLGCVPLVDI